MEETEAVARDVAVAVAKAVEAEVEEADEATIIAAHPLRLKAYAQPWVVMFLTTTRRELQNK